jgi:Ca2+-transporting ATPase
LELQWGQGHRCAREAADLVLMDDNFFSVVQAIALGRRIYDNLQKAMLYILSIHVPIVGLVLVPAFRADLPIIMLPVQIVFLELIIDPVCSVAFESQPAEPAVMRRSPRAGRAVFFSGPFFRTSLLYGLLLLCAALGVYFVSLFWGVGGAVARSGGFCYAGRW